MRQKYLSWNASAAARSEVIEYLEELIALAKLLVGASEFQTGLLTRPSYLEYVKAIKGKSGGDEDRRAGGEFKDDPVGDSSALARRRRRRTTVRSENVAGDVPASLRRIYSRKIEAGKLAAKN